MQCNADDYGCDSALRQTTALCVHFWWEGRLAESDLDSGNLLRGLLSRVSPAERARPVEARIPLSATDATGTCGPFMAARELCPAARFTRRQSGLHRGHVCGGHGTRMGWNSGLLQTGECAVRTAEMGSVSDCIATRRIDGH